MTMSFENSYFLNPLIIPEANNASFPMFHSRSSSYSSLISCESPSESINTQDTSPIRSPICQNGRLLLPKIRPQDQELPPSNEHTNLVPSPVDNVACDYSLPRRYTFSEIYSLPEPSSQSCQLNSVNPLSSIETANQRRASSFELSSQAINNYNFFPFNTIPACFPTPTNHSCKELTPSIYDQTQNTTSSIHSSVSFDDQNFMGIPDPVTCSTTTLMNYLSLRNPAFPLIIQDSVENPRVSNSKKYYWWDIRQIRSWDTFSLANFSTIPGLCNLLCQPILNSSLPKPPAMVSYPKKIEELSAFCNSFYATRLNFALSLSQSPSQLKMFAKPTNSEDACFISTYNHEEKFTLNGGGSARIVGILKLYGSWNSAMRAEDSNRKVCYLNGLSQLHYYMRKHGCKYGFILTEIEIAVVRNGTDNVPHFGYLDIQTFPLASHNDHIYDCDNYESPSNPPKMTVSLALWFLHMLAGNENIPGHVSWRSEIGSPAQGTRQKFLPRDKWTTEIKGPLASETRSANLARGWIWPGDPVKKRGHGNRRDLRNKRNSRNSRESRESGKKPTWKKSR